MKTQIMLDVRLELIGMQQLYTHFGKQRCKNGTQAEKCARRFTQLGISWPHKICVKKE